MEVVGDARLVGRDFVGIVGDAEAVDFDIRDGFDRERAFKKSSIRSWFPSVSMMGMRIDSIHSRKISST